MTVSAERRHSFGPFELHPAARTVLVRGTPARLGARAFDILLALVERHDRVVGKDELMAAVWPGLVVEENNLQVHVSALRKLLGPEVIATIPGRGYRFTAALDGEAAVPAEPLADRPGALAATLPGPRTRFIGREGLLAQAAGLLAAGRLLTFTGIGGCGKTRLAIELARQLTQRYPDGVCCVDLAPVQEPQRVAQALAEALRVREQADASPTAQIGALLGSRCVLVVLDNCEHVIDAAAELAEALLAGCARLTLLATSREGLGVEGEQILAVPPLSLLPGAPAADGSRPPCEAVRLFIDRARLVVPGFAAELPDIADIADICQRLDGIALAIELAAARVKLLSVADIRVRLDERFRFLTGGRRALPRHQTLQATLQWSHDNLTATEQQLLREFAVFVGGATLGATLAVAQERDPHRVLQTLTQLHDKSLLIVDRDGGEAVRYRMLETVRQYAGERLDASADAALVRGRHLGHFAALAEAAMNGLGGPQQALWFARLRVEQENLMAAHAWCAQVAQDANAALRLAAGLWRYWVASAQLQRGHAMTAEALAAAAAGSVDPAWTCRALWALGQLAYRMGRYDETLACGERCLALAGSLPAGDAAEHRAAGLILRAGGLYASGAAAQALPVFRAAIDASRMLGPNVGLVGALHGLAEVQRALGDAAAAQACYEESVAVARALGDPRATAVPLCNLARLLVGTGSLGRARAVLVESLELAASAGLHGLGEQALDVTAALCAATGDAPNAARWSGAALACMQLAASRRQPQDDRFVAPFIAAARAAIGDAAFTAAENEGREMGYAGAITQARAWLDGASAR